MRLLAISALLSVVPRGFGHAEQSRGLVEIPTVQSSTPGNHGNGGVDPNKFKCVLDPKITPSDLPFFIPDINDAWGAACGRNRGVFVLDPPDGHTYGCGNLPAEWGVTSVGDITNLEVTPAKVAISALGKLLTAIYKTTLGATSDACDFNSLTMLTCGREEPWRAAPWADVLNAPIRAVNIGGLFVLESWILPGFVQWGKDTGVIDQYSFSVKCKEMGLCDKLKAHWKEWYTPEDFQKMKSHGLNAIRLPVGWWYFAQKAALSHDPYIVPDEDLYDADHPLTVTIRRAKEAGLQVILDLHGAPGSQNGLDNSGMTNPNPNREVWGESWLYSPANMAGTYKTLAAIAEYIQRIDDQHGLDNIMALELLNEPWAFLDLAKVKEFYVAAIETVRLVRPHMPIIMHDSFRGTVWQSLLKNFPYKNVYMDTHIYHGFNPSDAASDDRFADRMKLYTHERMACSYSSLLRWETCAQLPVFVGEWSLAIDNCMARLDPKFENFGQCKRLKERLGDSWWTSHIRSFASRQIAMYEREMGWSFWAWKLDHTAETMDPSAAFWSFSRAVDLGYIDTQYPGDTCLHPPDADFGCNGSYPMPCVNVPPGMAPLHPSHNFASPPKDDNDDETAPATLVETTGGGVGEEQGMEGGEAAPSWGARTLLLALACGFALGAAAQVLFRDREGGETGSAASAGMMGLFSLFRPGYSSLNQPVQGGQDQNASSHVMA